MLFIICLVAAIVSCFLFWLFDRFDWDYASTITTFIGVPIAFTTAIMAIVLLITYIGIPRTEAKWQERYASLNTRIEEHMYYPWERGQLIQEVQDWNEDFSAQKAAQSNLWVSIFNPESIEGLDKIDLTRIE